MAPISKVAYIGALVYPLLPLAGPALAKGGVLERLQGVSPWLFVAIVATLILPLSVVHIGSAHRFERRAKRLMGVARSWRKKCTTSKRTAKEEAAKMGLECARIIHAMAGAMEREVCGGAFEGRLRPEDAQEKLRLCCDDVVEFVRVLCPRLLEVPLHAAVVAYVGNTRLAVVARDSQSKRHLSDTQLPPTDSEVFGVNDVMPLSNAVKALNGAGVWAADTQRDSGFDISWFAGPDCSDCAVAVRPVRRGIRDRNQAEITGFLVLYHSYSTSEARRVLWEEDDEIDERVGQIMAGVSDIMFPVMKRVITPVSGNTVGVEGGRFFVDQGNFAFLAEVHKAYMRGS
jgi:hypothetical protein